MRALFILFTLFAAQLAFGQSGYDTRLLAKYPDSQIRELQKSNPEVLAYWSFFLDNGYTISDIPAGKEGDFTKVVKVKDPERFNILSLPVGTPGEHPQYYRIDGTNKVLVVLSNDTFVRKFKAALANN